MPKAFPLTSPKKEKIVLYKPWLLVKLKQEKNDDDDDDEEEEEEGSKRISRSCCLKYLASRHFSCQLTLCKCTFPGTQYCPDSSLFLRTPTLPEEQCFFFKNFSL